MSRLLESLAVSGSRKSDGTANASGKVFLYEPGTTIRVAGYKDDQLSEAWTTVSGGIPLDAGGRVKIWVNDPVDVVVQDATGTTVDTFLGFNKTRAEQVEVENENYTGALTDDATGAVSQGLGGRIDLDTLLTRAGESLGPDFEYKESAGATARPYIEVIRDIAINVRDFGAVGNGIANDSTAITKAINRVKLLGGGTVYLPPGIYLVDQAFAVTSASNLVIAGAGYYASTIKSSNAGANGFTFSSCLGLTLRDFSIDHATSSSGASVVLTNCTSTTIQNAGNILDRYAIGLDTTGTGNGLVLMNATFFGLGAGTGRGLRIATLNNTIIGGSVGAKLATAIEFASAAGNVTMTGVSTGSSVADRGILFNSNLTGTKFVLQGSPSFGTLTTPVDTTGLAALSGFRQWGNGMASGTSSATGATQTPVLFSGNEVVLTAASGGAGTVTVAAPATLPGTGTDCADMYWDFVFKNAAGGAVTWSTNAIYVLAGAVAIPATAAHTIMVRFRWDITTSKLRECSRSDTLT